MKPLKQPWKLLEQSRWKPLFPVVLFSFQPYLLLLTKNKTCTFCCSFLLLLWIWLLFYFCRVYIYYESVHWFLFTFCLTLTPLCICFCYNSDYVITFFFSEICENVNGTKKKKKDTRQVGQNLKKLSRPAGTDDTDFNICLYVYISHDILKMFVVTFLFAFQ